MLTTPRHLILPAVLAAALALGACGSSTPDLDNVKKQGEALQQQGTDLQDTVKRLQAEVEAGTKTQAEADKELKAKTAELEGKAKKIGSDAIDAVKETDGVPDDAKKALEDAQNQLNTTP